MSTWKRSKTETPDTGRANAARQPPTEAPGRQAVQIEALELSVEDDAGCDPYNRTGQFLVDEIRKYQE